MQRQRKSPLALERTTVKPLSPEHLRRVGGGSYKSCGFAAGSCGDWPSLSDQPQEE